MQQTTHVGDREVSWSALTAMTRAQFLQDADAVCTVQLLREQYCGFTGRQPRKPAAADAEAAAPAPLRSDLRAPPAPTPTPATDAPLDAMNALERRALEQIRAATIEAAPETERILEAAGMASAAARSQFRRTGAVAGAILSPRKSLQKKPRV
jgi:hypothetical protein